ncbi:MAG: hypothetical protein AB7Q00_08010 [Phycisphaerales bacterium]
MTDTRFNSSRDLRWPPERFYWSIVESAVPHDCGWADPDTVGALAEPDVPVGQGSTDAPALHAAYARLDATTVLVCAVEPSQLDGVPKSTLTLTPNAIPEFVAGHDRIDAGRLNLLVGPFEPAEVRRVRSTRRLVSTLGALAATLLMCVGLSRHAEALRVQAKNARAQANSITHDAMGHPTIKAPKAALTEELDRLRLAGTRPTRSTPDAALALDRVLSAWPKGCTPTMLAVAPDAITTNVVVEDRRVLEGLVAPAGFEARPPRLSRAERGTAVALRWTRVQNQSDTPNGGTP